MSEAVLAIYFSADCDNPRVICVALRQTELLEAFSLTQN